MRGRCAGAMRRQGAVLLEAIIALAIAVSVGGAALTAMTRAADAVLHARGRAGQHAAASHFLEAMALWSRSDLETRLGRRANGPWRVTIRQPTRTLFEIRLELAADATIALTTVLYRDDE